MEYYGNNDYRDYLAHFGVKGMHWGIRRFQPYSVTGARKGGKTGKEIGLAKRVSDGLGGIKKGIKKKMTAHKRKASLEKAREAKKEKQEILRSGSAKKMMENKEKFTTDEIEEFMKRAQTETRLAELRQKQSAVNFEKADQINEGAKKVVGYLQTANNLFQQGQTLHKNVTDVAEMITGNKSKKEKEDIINSADPKKILENREKLSGEDIQKAYKRAQTEDLLRKMTNNSEDKDSKKDNNDSKKDNNDSKKDNNDSKKDNEPEKVSGTVEGVGRNSEQSRWTKGGSKPIVDVDWKEVKEPKGLSGGNNLRLDKGSSDNTPPSPSGGSSPKPTAPPSSGGSGNYLALPQGVSKSASQAAKASSMSEGIKLTFDAASGHINSSKKAQENARKLEEEVKKHSSEYKKGSANYDAVDALAQEFLKRMQ